MSSKQSHKLRSINNVEEVVARSRSLAEAAAKLGVNRSSLYRWRQAGKVGKAPRPKKQPPTESMLAGPKPGQTPEQWADAVREAGEMDPTRSMLLDLAVASLRLSQDMECRPETRLSAMGRFSQLVKQLNIDAGESAAVKAPTMNPARIARTGTDPRNILMAVK